MEVKMKEINMEHLKLEGQELKCVKDEKQSDLLKLRNDASKTETAIRELSETKNGAQNNLKSMQSEIDEETASKVVLEQRVDNEKNLTQQILHSKFVKSDQRLEDANLKLAGELRHIVTSIGENDQQLEELNHKKVEINMNVRNLELTKVEKLKFMKEVAGGFTKSSVDNRGLLDKITSMAQTLEYVKKNTLLV
jgi:predicted  nucleic acid-binding Zn-ribbon protein